MTNRDDEESEREPLQSIFRGASFFSIGYAASTAFNFFAQFLLTRLLGAAGYGVFAYAYTLHQLALKVSNLGTDKSLMRYLPAATDDRATQRGILTLAYGTSLVASLVTAVAAIVLAPTIANYTIDTAVFVDVLRLFAIILVFDTLSKAISSTFRALEMAEFDILIYRIGRPGMLMVSAVISFALGLQLFETVAVVLAGSVFVFGFAVWLTIRKLSITPGRTVSSVDIRSYYNFSVPLASKDLGSFFYLRADIIMVGFFLSSSTVGVYNIAVLLTTLISLPLKAVNQLFPPVASKLYTADDLTELSTVYAAVSRWSMTCSLPLVTGAILYHRELLSLFGAEFAAGGSIVVVLALAKFVDTAVGPSGYMLMMTDHQYLLLANQWTFAMLNIALNYVFILEFGVIGAAYASALVLAGLNLLRVAEVWYLEGLHPFSWRFFKPVVAGVPAALTMVGASRLVPLEPIPAMFVGGACGCLAYAIALYTLGLEERDQQLYNSVT